MSRYKEESIKKSDKHIKPNITRSKNGKIMSIGLVDGQRYYIYNKTISKIDSSFPFGEKMHKEFGTYNRYINEIARLIDNGQIFIEYIEPVKEVKKVNKQMSMF